MATVATQPTVPILIGDEWWQQLLSVGLQKRWDTEQQQAFTVNQQVPLAQQYQIAALNAQGTQRLLLVGGLFAGAALLVYLFKG